MATSDLKRIDIAEWRRQTQWTIFSQLVVRMLCGLFLAALIVKSATPDTNDMLDPTRLMAFLFVVAFLVFSVVTFKRSLKKMNVREGLR